MDAKSSIDAECKGLSIEATEVFVKRELANLGPDASHDWWCVFVLMLQLLAVFCVQILTNILQDASILQAY